MKAVILGGGVGSRMGEMTRDLPKPMIRIGGLPILEHQINVLKRYGLIDILILTCYKSEVIEHYFDNGSRWGVNIAYSKESKPLGTAGAVKSVEHLLKDDFLVLYGDIIFDMDLSRLCGFHKQNKSIATLVAHPNDHPYDSDLIETDNSGKVAAFHSKPHPAGMTYRNLVNAGIGVFSQQLLKPIKPAAFADFGRNILPEALKSGEVIYAYNTPEYIKDIGTIERLQSVEKDITSGKVARLNRKNKKNIVFIDRDGVINDNSEEITHPDKLVIFPGVAEAIKKLNKSDFAAVIVTNQPAIAKGFLTEGGLSEVHKKLETILGENHAFIDRIYYCPHHPEKGFEGENKKYKVDCNCRKPKTGMLDAAMKELNGSIEGSYIIGDRTVDIMTGRNAGLKTILVKTGSAGKDGKYDCKPDFVFNDLNEAVDYIISEVK